MGLTDEEIHRPWVGVASTWNEATPCNLTLDRQAKAAKEGVKAAGGTPREFVTIAVSDGIAMGHEGMKASLVSREVIADSIELMMHAHGYDALVGLAGCDKSLPGTLMAMARLNVPSVFLYGGTILPGKFKGRDVTIQDVYEAVGANSAGKMSDADLYEMECGCVPIGGKLRRTIHGQHDGVRGGGDGDGAARQRFPAGGGCGARCVRRGKRQAGDAADGEESSCAGHHDARSV